MPAGHLRGQLSRALEQVPVRIRTAGYAAVFLPVLLVALPWLAHRAGLAWLPFRLEIGPWRWLGWALFALAFVGYTAASAWLVRSGEGPYVEFDPPTALVTTGPYAWCRNPVVACGVVMLVGLGLAFSSIGILLFAALTTVLGHAQVVRIEEPRLTRRFGPAYEAYRRRAPRWIPRRLSRRA